MKTERGGFRMLRREQLMDELVHDTYKAGAKLADGTVCPDCGATFRRGRWTLQPAAAAARRHLCPACNRVRDRLPAGYVSLGGDFLAAHREEILALVRHCESDEKSRHPLERIMAIEDAGGGLSITTTGTHIARRIAEHLHDAFKGDLEFHYNREENLLRAAWRR